MIVLKKNLEDGIKEYFKDFLLTIPGAGSMGASYPSHCCVVVLVHCYGL